MTQEYELLRYAAYFRGWCQAFGGHDSIPGTGAGASWLFGKHQAGFILPPERTRPLYREVLRKHGTQVLELGEKEARIDAFHSVLSGAADASLFMTSRFMYGTATRIITLAGRKPLPVIYKEIGPMRIRLDRAAS